MNVEKPVPVPQFSLERVLVLAILYVHPETLLTANPVENKSLLKKLKSPVSFPEQPLA